MSLTEIGDQLTLYSGCIFLFTGLIGNGINTFVFSRVRTYRTTPCTFYFLVGSIDNIVYILINLIARIVAARYDIDLTRTSIVWCKSRAFLAASLSPISFTCSCVAAIDQFLVTSQNVNLRRCSNIKLAYRIVIGIIGFWSIHGIFAPVFYNITTVRCASTNAIYAIYSTIYVTIVITTIPVVIMIVFGGLTYRNIRLTRVPAQQHADRQLLRMILFQILLISLSILPYGINSTYRLITSTNPKSTDQQLRETFVTTVVTLVTYFYFSGSCYIFLLSSTRFRQTVKKQICWCLTGNQIHP
ncbi:unnamed protein product [Adineta ricciae]|uniref:G-protein coupled receptors family 1 profile domain-containing protein n=1 Tax=Adineta ricciae TaxID=249248 RepID=A0A816DWZ0_ADIRI|nr:unnamed protein product [Adineta ricciae]